MSSLERLGEAGWLPDVRSEESLAAPPAPGVKPAQPTAVQQLFRFGEAWAALRAENLLTYLCRPSGRHEKAQRATNSYFDGARCRRWTLQHRADTAALSHDRLPSDRSRPTRPERSGPPACLPDCYM